VIFLFFSVSPAYFPCQVPRKSRQQTFKKYALSGEIFSAQVKRSQLSTARRNTGWQDVSVTAQVLTRAALPANVITEN